MATRFDSIDNSLFPLPSDYESLTAKGQRLARLNACFMQETPEDFVAAWAFFRSYYLFPPATPIGAFYKHGVLPSPSAHYQIVYSVAANQLNLVAAPRSFAKSTLMREINLLEVLTRPHWEIVMFLAKDAFVAEQMDIYKNMIEHNDRIRDDFQWYWSQVTGRASLKPIRGQGLWSNHVIKMTNGSSILGLPIMGAALGKRPHRIRFDDVERDKSLVKEPTEQIDAFRNMLMNVVYPMAEEGCGIDIFGTILSRRSFLYWMQKTSDPRIADHWARVLLAVKMNGTDIWKEKMGVEWQERQKATMGTAAFNTQYMNEPGTESDRVLKLHDKLNTYAVQSMDQALVTNPLASQATLVSHVLTGYEGGTSDGRPIPSLVSRPFGEVVSKMYRFITVDFAPTVSESSDYSCIHVMGIENSKAYKDTLWSLDLFLGKVRQRDLVQKVYQMAIQWKVRVVGVEAYGVQLELYERMRSDLPELFGFGSLPPAVIPIKFPPQIQKQDKIKGLEWRFSQFRVKLPWHRRTESGYGQLFKQIEDFTDDLALLQHDDAIDTLAMHQAIGKPPIHDAPDIVRKEDDLYHLLEMGRQRDSAGIPILAGIDINRIPPDVLRRARDKARSRQVTRDLRWLPCP